MTEKLVFFRALLLLSSAMAIQGCATTFGTKIATPFGYIKDHPGANNNTNYLKVKEWAYDVSDGYSSRGTMNRYSLYWGGALAAGGIGAMSGLAATGYTGHANIILPLTAGFIATMFGFYQNEEHAQLYYAASSSLLTLIEKSEKRLNMIMEERTDSIKASIDNNIFRIHTEKSSEEKRKMAIFSDSRSMVHPQLEVVSAIGRAINEADNRISLLNNRSNIFEMRRRNLDELIAAGYNEPDWKYGAGVLQTT